MDSARFDALTRSLGEGMTRRGITRLLGGLALGGLLPSLASAAKKDDQHETGGTGKKGDHAKKDGTGHRKPDTDRPNTGKARAHIGQTPAPAGPDGQGQDGPARPRRPQAGDRRGGRSDRAS